MLYIKLNGDESSDITFFFPVTGGAISNGSDISEGDRQADFEIAAGNAGVVESKIGTLFASSSNSLTSIWGGYGDTETVRVQNAQFGYSKTKAKNSFQRAGAFTSTGIDNISMTTNEYYTYSKNGRQVKYTGSLMQVYDAQGNLLGSSALPTAANYPYFVTIPDSVPDDMTITEWRNQVNVGYLQPSFRIDYPGGVVSNFLTQAYVNPQNTDQSKMDYADWLYYLLKGTDPSFEEDDPYIDPDSPIEPSGPGGGDGDNADPADEGDDIPYPDDPTISVGDSGLLEIYIPTAVQLNLLAGYLWSNNFVTSLVKDLYADPMDVIISLGFLPFAITAAGSRNIKVGDRDSGVASNYPSSGYFNFDCGSVDLKTVIGSYLDYAPYTKGQLFLPYIGYVPLDIDAYMGKTISIKYKVDISNGSATAFIMANNKVMQQFACNLLTPIPLSGANYSEMWGSVLAATATLAGAGALAGGAMGGAAAAGATESVAGAAEATGGTLPSIPSASGIMTGMATKPDIQKSNNVGVSTGLLGIQYPYITLERPNLCIPSQQNSIMGYPSYITAVLSSCSGYTRVSQMNLAVPGATAVELGEIESYLKSGVIIGNGAAPSGSGIVLYNNGSPKNQIRKNLTSVATLTGTFRDSVDIHNPVFRIERTNPIGFNYVYISDFGRCYYVTEVNAIRKDIMEVHCKCDPLNSFASQILANKAIIDKQQNNYNLYLNDDSIKTYQNPLISTWKFPNSFGAAYTYVLLVAGS